MGSDRDDLLSLLSKVNGQPGVEVKVGAAPKVDVTPPSGSGILPTTPAPQASSEETEIYAKLTLGGLRKHRPDLVQALEKSAGRTPAPDTPKRTASKNAFEDYQNYIQVSTGLLQSDANQVTGRRLANVRAKYLKALAEANVVLSSDTDVTFVVNGARIQAVWAGPVPTLPDALKV